ncbi:MAG: NAD(+) synthase [Deltaproteobacteria bacterium]|nr:NAD(+) synthase [Deltaproteobacteria bacterium]
MKLVKVAAAVLNQTPLDWDGNLRRMREAIARAREQNVGLLCLPELCVTGYGCEDAFRSRGVPEQAMAQLMAILPDTRGMIVSLGLPVAHHNALFNCAALCADGKLLGLTAKQHLAGDGVHYEPRWFKPWPDDVRALVDTPAGTVPIGDLFYDCGGVKVGFEICEDAWVARRPGASLSLQGVDIILNPSASHFAFAKHAVRQRFVLEGSRAFGVTYVYANLLGNEAGRVIYDGDAFLATNGRLVAQGPRFSFAELQITSAVIDLDATRTTQLRTASFTPEAFESDSRIVTSFAPPACSLAPEQFAEEPWSLGPRAKEEELARAESIALFDYLRKSRSMGFVLSLSGGADSSATASLVRLMVELGTRELGLAGFAARLPHMPALALCKSTRELMSHLLLCVYQRTKNSSQATLDSARAVAEGVGAGFQVFDVDALVADYTAMVEKALGRPLSWTSDDAALQNIQARVRSPGVWMLANVRNALLLSTSNRSEAAVGYATMDGDTSGGLAPIAGIDKNFLRRFLRWLESEGPHGVGAMPYLAAVNAQAPGPELRPLDQKQTGEGDLMPYDLLDAVERAAIRDKLLPLEVFARMRAHFPQHDARALATWIDRFFKLWCRNQWKRERYAPSFHLDDENLDPKTWCRFPILSSGFARELAAMWAHPELK